MRLMVIGTWTMSCMLFSACGGGSTSSGLVAAPISQPVDPSGGPATVASQNTEAGGSADLSRWRRKPEPTPSPAATAAPSVVGVSTPTPGSGTLCVSGTQYGIVQDDEFATDTTLSTSPDAVPVTQSSAPKISWSTQFNWGGGAFYNNGGTDDAYYEDPALRPSLNPFSIGGGSLGINATPLAVPTTAPDGYTRHWGSGELTGPPITYGYLEVSAKMPNMRGFWPAFWLHAANGNNFLGGATAAEYDVFELFGDIYPAGTIQQTSISAYGSGVAKYLQSAVPTAGTAYHTYGILWTSTGVNFYIDRVPKTPVWPNWTSGPENAQITLQVFANGTWAPPPATATPQTMSLLYYRAYQATNASCSPTVIASPPASLG